MMNTQKNAILSIQIIMGEIFQSAGEVKTNL